MNDRFSPFFLGFTDDQLLAVEAFDHIQSLLSNILGGTSDQPTAVVKDKVTIMKLPAEIRIADDAQPRVPFWC